MMRTPGMAWMWPGLPQLWRRGSWSGLALGLAFAAVLNLAVVATWGWTEWPGTAGKTGVWLLVGLVWLGGLVWAWMDAQTERATLSDSPALEDLFSAALDEYLQGNWVPAEEGLRTIIRRQPSDVSARLTLAALLRRTRRPADAREQLAILRTMEVATDWKMEIDREWTRVEQTEAIDTNGTKPATEGSTDTSSAKTAANDRQQATAKAA